MATIENGAPVATSTSLEDRIPVRNGELLFSKDQIVTATDATRNFKRVREQAKNRPQFIQGRTGEIEVAVLDFSMLQDLMAQIEELRMERFYDECTQRLEDVDAGRDQAVPIEDVLGRDWEQTLTMAGGALTDEDLFE